MRSSWVNNDSRRTQRLWRSHLRTHSTTLPIVGHLCSQTRLWWTAGDSCSVPATPTEEALNHLKGKRAARLKIKQEKTFQRELFTGHDSGGGGGLRRPFTAWPPGSECVALPVLFFIPRITERSNSAAPFDPVARTCFIITLRCQHRPLFVTSECRSEFSPWLFVPRRIRAPDGGNDICSSSGGDGQSCHLAKPSGALYVSDLHVSTCSKYNLLAFADEPWADWLPEGETGERGAWETEVEREKLSWETSFFFVCVCVYKHSHHESHSGAATSHPC